MDIEKTAAQIIAFLLEDEDDIDLLDVARGPEHIEGINTELMKVLSERGINADRIITRYGDVCVMCRNYDEAAKIRNAGKWRSMAEVARTNPEDPDAKEFPWLCDIPFANLAGYIASQSR